MLEWLCHPSPGVQDQRWPLWTLRAHGLSKALPWTPQKFLESPPRRSRDTQTSLLQNTRGTSVARLSWEGAEGARLLQAWGQGPPPGSWSLARPMALS